VSAVVDRVIPIAADVRNPSAVSAAIEGAQSVVNAVSTYVERGGVTYTAVHVHGAGNVATACQQQNVARLVHISGIGADPVSRSTYIRARGLGELAVQKAFPNAIILRPGVMFAADGGLLNILERIAQSTLVIPLVGTGATRLQPVHADDVAEAVCLSLRDPASAGKTYELAGPETYTVREIFDLILARMERSRRFIYVPFTLAAPLARILESLPSAPLILAQVDLLRNDNVVGPGAAGFEQLSITPHNLRDMILALVGFRGDGAHVTPRERRRGR